MFKKDLGVYYAVSRNKKKIIEICPFSLNLKCMKLFNFIWHNLLIIWLDYKWWVSGDQRGQPRWVLL